MTTFTIFFSWQSDSPVEANQRLIREALRAAATRLEVERESEARRLHRRSVVVGVIRKAAHDPSDGTGPWSVT